MKSVQNVIPNLLLLGTIGLHVPLGLYASLCLYVPLVPIYRKKYYVCASGFMVDILEKYYLHRDWVSRLPSAL